MLSLVVFAASACDDDRGKQKDDASASSPIASFGAIDGGEGFDNALLEGSLVVSDGCIYVKQSDASSEMLTIPAFEEGSYRWDAKESALQVQGVELRDGDDVEFAGGVSPPGESNIHLPRGCDTSHAVWRVNPDGGVVIPAH